MRTRPSATLLTFVIALTLTPALANCHGSGAGSRRAASADPVSVGYGTQRRGAVTGSVFSLSAEEIDRVHGQDMARLLEGRIPGLLVYRQGGNVMLSIRGGGPPHVVIDGAPASVADLLSLPPETVHRIDVRKDGGAAVYGWRSADGVIEVTMRRGAHRD